MNEKTNTPETLAAILAEIRARAEEERECGWNGEADDLLAWADRIEAATARPCSARHAPQSGEACHV